MTVEELQVLITANTTALQKEIQKVKGSINGLTKNTTESEVLAPVRTVPVSQLPLFVLHLYTSEK